MRVTIEPDASSAPMGHAGEQAVVVLAGCGKLLLDGAPSASPHRAPLVVPPRTELLIVDDGAEPLRLLDVLAT